MKIRPLPIFLSFLFTGLLLFGGWYTYQDQFVKKPIRDEIAKMKDVTLKSISVGKDTVLLDVTFNQPKQFKTSFLSIQRIAQEQSGGKKVSLNIISPENNVKKIWDDHQFLIAEAIDLHQYSKIPNLFNDLQKKNLLKEVDLQMDEQYIYVYMSDGQSSFYKVLTRTKEVNQKNG